MLGVQVLINGEVIFARTAVNRGETNSSWDTRGKLVCYETDTGEIVWHDPDDGAVVLAKKLLDTIKEQR